MNIYLHLLTGYHHATFTVNELHQVVSHTVDLIDLIYKGLGVRIFHSTIGKNNKSKHFIHAY